MQHHLFLQNRFDSEAKRLYCAIVLKSANYAAAKQILEEKYCTIVRQNHVTQDLFGLHLTKVIEQEDCSAHEALEKVRRESTTLATHGPKSQSSEEEKVEHSLKSMIGIDCAKTALRNNYT